MDKKITTTYDEQTLIDFKRFTLTKKSHFKPAVLYLLCIAVVILAFVYNKRFELNFTTVIYPLISILCMVAVTIIYYLRPIGKNRELLDKSVEYNFCDESIFANDREFEFEEFTKIYEDKYYFYFYLSETEGFLIDKEQIEFDMTEYLSDRFDKKVLRLNKAK